MRSQTASVPSELTDDDKAILVALLRETIERDRFPLSPRVRSFRAILVKFDPRPAVETLPVPSRRTSAAWR
jgi:hypothetical protein